MPRLDRKLFARPPEQVAALMAQRDRAQVRAAWAFCLTLSCSGCVVIALWFIGWFAGHETLRGILQCLGVVVPVLVGIVLFSRVPPLPFEAVGDPRRDLVLKENGLRTAVAMQAFLSLFLCSESVWLWPRRFLSDRLVALGTLAPVFVMIVLVILTLYRGLGWGDPDLRALWNDEVTKSFQARAKSLGYLVMILVFLGFAVLSRINPVAAARYMPLGLAVGMALPVLYFVYLDWRASRGG